MPRVGLPGKVLPVAGFDLNGYDRRRSGGRAWIDGAAYEERAVVVVGRDGLRSLEGRARNLEVDGLAAEVDSDVEAKNDVYGLEIAFFSCDVGIG